MFLPVLLKINEILTILLQKKNQPTQISHFRLISLCNVTYKIIFKILVARLKPFLDIFISPFKANFVQNILIGEHKILAQEVVMRKKKRREAFLGVKIDMNKAYDKME